MAQDRVLATRGSSSLPQGIQVVQFFFPALKSLFLRLDYGADLGPRDGGLNRLHLCFLKITNNEEASLRLLLVTLLVREGGRSKIDGFVAVD